MGFLKYFTKNKPSDSASQARDRLQVIVAHQRANLDGSAAILNSSKTLNQLQVEIMTVLNKYIPIKQDDVNVNVEKQDQYSILELNVTLPENKKTEQENV